MLTSDTTNKNGLIQECEFWTNLGDGVISGDATLLKVFINRLNRAFDTVLPLIISLDDTMQWDDTNHTKHPIATTNLVSGQQDYGALADEDGNSILNVVKVFIKQNATATDYVELRRVLAGTQEESQILNPAPAFVGIPTKYLERGAYAFLGAVPNYDATAGIKLAFERSPSYLDSGSLTKKPGIPELFQPLLAHIASLDWLLVNKPEAATLVTRLEARIKQERSDLEKQNVARFPKRKRITGARTNSV